MSELRLLKARIKQLEEKVATQDRQHRAARASIEAQQSQQKAIQAKTFDIQSKQQLMFTKQTTFENRLKRVAYGPPTTSTTTGPVGISKPGEHWYERLSLRGYTQARINSFVGGDRELYRLPGDRSVGKDQNFLLRRVRLILSGDVSDNLFLYIQPDFASTPGGATTGNFGQLRDAYADIFLDKNKEFRIRAGQSKIPYSFENMQSSQNRLALDRNDALNTCCRDERDVGAFFYYTPEHLRPVFRDLVKNNLKGSGDYGMFALGVYNGQGANRVELNNELHVVSRFTYPYTFANGQIVEAGVQGIVGRFVPTTGSIGGVTPALVGSRKGYRDERVGVHAVLYPQPFGLQAEYNWGRGPQLDQPQTSIETRSLEGGYVQASYKYEDRLFKTGIYFPFIKYQYFRGASKFETNAPINRVDDYEAGVEWQIRPELELTTTYSRLHRTNLFTAPFSQFRADIIRTQLQFNY